MFPHIKRRILFTVIICMVFLTAQSLLGNDYTITEIADSITPGSKVILDASFSGIVSPTMTITNYSCLDQYVKIVEVQVTSINPIQSGGTPVPDQEYYVNLKISFEVSISSPSGRTISFNLYTSDENKISGRIKIAKFNNFITAARPKRVNSGTQVDIDFTTNNLLKGSIVSHKISPGGAQIFQAYIESANLIKASVEVPASAAGKYLSFEFRVGNQNEYETFTGIRLIPVIDKEPVISSAKPNTFTQGETNAIIEITGENFPKDAVLKILNRSIEIQNFNRVSDTLLKASLNINPSAPTGPVDVELVYSGGRISAANLITIQVANPKIVRLNPSKISASSTTQTITVIGKNFTKDTDFKFSGFGINIINKVFLNSERVTLQISLQPNVTAGYYDLNASSTYRNVTARKSKALQIEDEALTVARIYPNFAEQGNNSANIQFEGTGFQNGMTIAFDSNSINVLSTGVISSESAYANLSISSTAPQENVNITLSNPGKSSIVVKNSFKIIPKQYKNRLSLITPGVDCFDLEENEGNMETLIKSEIDNLYPVFQWDSNADSIDLYIFKAIPGQRQATEIISNTPFFKKSEITRHYFTYPLEARELEPGVRYYWKLNANFSGKIASSEIWCFTIRNTE